MALVMAMIVVVLVTLLVAGAISFTGTELAASRIQTQEDRMSACMQAARNLFIAKLNLLDPQGPTKIKFEENLGEMIVRTGHLGSVDEEVSAIDVTKKMEDPDNQVQDISNRDTYKKKSGYFYVTVVCREDDEADSPEREIEFMVRVGL
jgi:hypothetical protein